MPREANRDKELKRLLYNAKLLFISGQKYGYTDPRRVQDWLRQFNAILPPTNPFTSSDLEELSIEKKGE